MHIYYYIYNIIIPPPLWLAIYTTYTATREADSKAINCRLELSTNLT